MTTNKVLTVDGVPTGRLLPSCFTKSDSFTMTGNTLSSRQKELLLLAQNEPLVIDGTEGPVSYTAESLKSIFSGQQIPRDEKVCAFLGIPKIKKSR